MQWSSWDEWSELEEEQPERNKKGTRGGERKGYEKREEAWTKKIIEKYKKKVLIFKRGPKWIEEKPVEDWIEEETGEKVAIEYIKGCEDVVKIWCDREGTKDRIWEKSEDWKRRGWGKIEEWKSMEERRKGREGPGGEMNHEEEQKKDLRTKIAKRRREKDDEDSEYEEEKRG
jgi:hypothetical protein